MRNLVQKVVFVRRVNSLLQKVVLFPKGEQPTPEGCICPKGEQPTPEGCTCPKGEQLDSDTSCGNAPSCANHSVMTLDDKSSCIKILVYDSNGDRIGSAAAGGNLRVKLVQSNSVIVRFVPMVEGCSVKVDNIESSVSDG